MTRRTIRHRSAGFTLVELMVSLAVLTVMISAIVMLITTAQTGSFVEQGRLDAFQEAREFVDQLSRDLRDAGYPNRRNYSAADATKIRKNSPVNAVGLVKVDTGDLWFEGTDGSVYDDGTPKVWVIRYHWDSEGTNCPCLRRSQQPKIDGDPLAGQTDPVYQIEVQNVLNGSGDFPMSTNPIFKAYAGLTPVTLPIDINNNPDAISKITNIQLSLTVRSRFMEAVTKQQPTMTLVSTVRVNNCSIAADSNSMSC